MHCLDHSWSAVLGQVVLSRRCATPGAVFVRAVRSVARGDTTGAVLGRALGHYDKCRGLDSQDRRFSYCGAEAVPRCPDEVPSSFFHGGRCPCCGDATGCSLPVVIPQVRFLDRLCQSYVGGSVARGFIFLVGFSSLPYFYCHVVTIRCCVLCSRQSVLCQSSLSLEVRGFTQTQYLSPS